MASLKAPPFSRTDWFMLGLLTGLSITSLGWWTLLFVPVMGVFWYFCGWAGVWLRERVF